MEIASNDGYLLKNFVENNIKCLGIEPTRSTAQEAIKKDIPTIVDFFNLELAGKLEKEGSQADLVIANNWNPSNFDYDSVTEINDPDLATQYRII